MRDWGRAAEASEEKAYALSTPYKNLPLKDPQPEPIFHHATALHTAVDMLDPQPPLVEHLVGQVLFQGELRTAGLLRRHEDRHLRERERQKAQILQQPTPSRERVGGGLRDAQIMGTAAVGVAQKEDDEQGIDESGRS